MCIERHAPSYVNVAAAVQRSMQMLMYVKLLASFDPDDDVAI